MENIKELFFRETLRRWHFEDIVRELKISRERVNYYLKNLVNDNFLKRIKYKGRMPYYIVNRESDKFRIEKRFYGLKILENSGLLTHINSLKDIRTSIVFGSFARGDWGKSSDIDLFIYGSVKDFNKVLFETKLNREIQLFNYETVKEIKQGLDPKIIPNIIKGFNIKGSIDPFEVRINA